MKIYGLSLLLLISNLSFAQTKLDLILSKFDFLHAKRNQIERLNIRIDSLNDVIEYERKYAATITDTFSNTIGCLETELTSTTYSLLHCQTNFDDLHLKLNHTNDTIQRVLNTWKFSDSTFNPIPPEEWRDLSIYQENWSNTNLFPYVYAKNNSIPDSLVVHLFEKDSGFSIPVEGYVSSGFGMRRGRMHKGLDVRLNRHDTVRACMSGIVRFADYNSGGFGNIIIIRHLNGIETYYAHLHKMAVKPNDIVYAGDFIGTGGSTGTKRTGPHLHFECRWKDYPFDPRLFMDYDQFQLKEDTLFISSDVLNTKPLPTRKKYHTVKSGDTLYGIALKHNTTVSKLCQINGIRKNAILQVNQRIRIK